MTEPGPWTSVDQILDAERKRLGDYFFNFLRGWLSTEDYPDVYAGRYYISSDAMLSPRHPEYRRYYSVNHVSDDAVVRRHASFWTLEESQRCARLLATTQPHSLTASYNATSEGGSDGDYISEQAD